MSDGENIVDKQLIDEVCDSLKEEKNMVPQTEEQGFFSSLFGSKKEEKVEEEKVEEEKQGFFSSLFGSKKVEEEKVEEEKVEEEKVEEEKVEEEKIDCDDLLMKMKKCTEDKDDSTQCHEIADKWGKSCNSRSWFGN